jgi:putative transposase
MTGWGYDRILGALANLGFTVSDQTVGNILKRHGIAPAPKRSQNTTWKEFIQSHLAVLVVEVLQLRRMSIFTLRGTFARHISKGGSR